MTAQGAFLLYVKAHAGLVGHEAAKVLQVDKLMPRFKSITRTEPFGEVVGGMQFTHRIDTGKLDKDLVEVYVRSVGYNIPLTGDGVKAKLRRLRPQEAARLAEIDAEYEMHRQAMQALAADRKALLREAFTKGHRVTVEELRAAAEAKGTIEETVDG